MATQISSPKRGQRPPIFGPYLLWPIGWMYQDATWYGDRPWPRPHCARWGPSSPKKKGHSPQFSAHFYCGQTAGWIKMPLGTDVGLDPGDIVLDGEPAPPPQWDTAPQFSAHVCCRQMAGWTKMTLGVEVGLSPGDFVRLGLSSPSEKRHSLTQFSAHVYCGHWPNGWMDEDATLYGSSPRPRPHCIRPGSSSVPAKGAQQPAALFGPCLLWPRSPISSYC